MSPECADAVLTSLLPSPADLSAEMAAFVLDGDAAAPPQYPCVGELEFFGGRPSEPAGVWSCGLRQLRAPCAIYSIGAEAGFVFEALASLATPCEVVATRCAGNASAAHSQLPPRTSLVSACLGRADAASAPGGDNPHATLPSLMRLGGHTAVDFMSVRESYRALPTHADFHPTLLALCRLAAGRRSTPWTASSPCRAPRRSRGRSSSGRCERRGAQRRSTGRWPSSAMSRWGAGGGKAMGREAAAGRRGCAPTVASLRRVTCFRVASLRRPRLWQGRRRWRSRQPPHLLRSRRSQKLVSLDRSLHTKMRLPVCQSPPRLDRSLRAMKRLCQSPPRLDRSLGTKKMGTCTSQPSAPRQYQNSRQQSRGLTLTLRPPQRPRPLRRRPPRPRAASSVAPPARPPGLPPTPGTTPRSFLALRRRVSLLASPPCPASRTGC